MFPGSTQEANMQLADQNYYLDRDRRKVVTEDSPEQAFLLVGKGCEIPDDIAKRFPAVLGKGKKAADDDDAKAKSPAENKSKAPAGNK